MRDFRHGLRIIQCRYVPALTVALSLLVFPEQPPDSFANNNNVLAAFLSLLYRPAYLLWQCMQPLNGNKIFGRTRKAISFIFGCYR
jgi:hypothetical protein